MASTLTLTFSDSNFVVLNETIIINFSTPTATLSIIETFKTLRESNFQVTLPVLSPEDEFTAISFANAFNLDANIKFDVFDATQVGNQVVITLNDPSWQFLTTTGTAIDNSKVTSLISNVPVEDAKTVTITDYTKEVGSECTLCNAIVTVTGGTSPYTVFVDNASTITAESPITVPIARELFKSFRVVDSVGTLIGSTITQPTRKLIAQDISLSIATFTTGSTLTISVSFISEKVSDYTYSLDGVTYQASNVYSGLLAGEYTVYVKDGFDCVTTNAFIIDGETELTETVFNISDINAFRFAKVDDEKKNQRNTLSFNELRTTTYGYKQKFIDTDIVTTQFRTNAQYINAYSINNEGLTNDLSIVKKTENTGLKAKSTCTYFDLGNNKSGVYFGIVDELDFVTEAVIEQVNYGSALPVWANTIGQPITLDGIGELLIDNIGYSETYNSFILEFNLNYNGSPITDQIISARYNIQPYEIYEFQTPVSNQFQGIVENAITKLRNRSEFFEAENCVKFALEEIYRLKSYYQTFVDIFKERCEFFEAEQCVLDFLKEIYPQYVVTEKVPKTFNVVVEAGADINNIEYTYITECVEMVNDSEFLFDITYWNDENVGNFNYQTGIINKLRIFGFQDDIGEQTTEGYNGNKDYYVTDNEVYDVQQFTFDRLSTQMANKLRLVVAHDNLLINGLFYKLAESPEVTGNENYNMKKFVVKLKQNGDLFLTDEQEQIVNASDSLELSLAIASAKNTGLLAWTKNI